MANDVAPAGTAKAAMRYAAFISYSHADTEICDRLHKRLESYEVPHSLVGRNGPQGKIGKRLGKFFRDRADLGAHHNLGAEIREALEHSAALIVLCSPKSAGSRYVEDEIRHFKALGRGNQVFAAIISGEPHAAGKPGLSAADECFPRALIYRVGTDGQLTQEPEATEPIAADLRDKRDGLENGALKLIAGLLDIGLDDLVQREKQAEARRRRQAYMISGAMSVLAIGAGVGGVLAWMNGETVQAQAKTLAKNNETLTANKIEIEAKNVTLEEQKADLAQRLRENQALTTRITSVVGEISGIAASDPNVPDTVLMMAYAARQGMSAQSLNLFWDNDFPPHLKEFRGEIRSKNFCLATVCLPAVSADRFIAVFSDALTSTELDLIKSVDWASRPAPPAELANLKVSRRQGMRAFGEVTLPDWAGRVRAALPPSLANLHPDCIGALVSIALNGGVGRIKEIAGAALEEGRAGDVPAAIRADGDKLSARSMGSVIKKRRYEEAALFEQGLKAMAEVAASAPS